MNAPKCDAADYINFLVASPRGERHGALARGCRRVSRHHARILDSHLHLKRPAPAYYAAPPGYAYYVPTHVFRCYPARAMVRDQVGFTAGYLPLGTCG